MGRRSSPDVSRRMRPALIERTVQALREALLEAAKEAGWPMAASDVPLGPPRESTHGDLATPVALGLARRVGLPPREIADRLRLHLERAGALPVDFPLERIEIAGPGFLNFRFAPAWMEGIIPEIVAGAERWGRSRRLQGRSLLLEFVSANPTGPLNVVSARAAAVGDALASLCAASGARVGREFYVNDAGRQVELLGASLQARIRQAEGGAATLPEEGYQGEYLVELARRFLQEPPPWWSHRPAESESEQISLLSEWAVERMLEQQQQVLARFGLHFDRWYRESSLHEQGAVQETLEALRERGGIYESEGATWLRATEFGDEKDRVLVTGEGRPTYLLPDIAYHRDKFARGWETVVDLWGPDHHGYISRMQAALQCLGHAPEHFRVLIVQQVNLLRGGEAVKMSKRLGRLIEMEELIEEVGTDAARFLFLTRATSTPLDFDLDLAVARNEENPVYYVQYAHARLCRLLEKAADQGLPIQGALDPTPLPALVEPEARMVMRLLASFPEVVADAACQFEPHRVPAYLRELAAAFHVFYHHHQVVGSPEPVQGARLALCRAARIVLANGLALIGVSAPERM
jgi:arginyl-tRNA synthetase